jgi:hypothetical protein
VKHWKSLQGQPFRTRNGMLTSSVVLLHDNVCPHTAACTQALLEHFNWKLLWATTTCLPTWRTGWDNSASTIMMSWWKVSEHGWAHRRQTSLAQTYKNLHPDTRASFPVVTVEK